MPPRPLALVHQAFPLLLPEASGAIAHRVEPVEGPLLGTGTESEDAVRPVRDLAAALLDVVGHEEEAIHIHPADALRCRRSPLRIPGGGVHRLLAGPRAGEGLESIVLLLWFRHVHFRFSLP